jgi:hypothetical protein
VLQPASSKTIIAYFMVLFFFEFARGTTVTGNTIHQNFPDRPPTPVYARASKWDPTAYLPIPHTLHRWHAPTPMRACYVLRITYQWLGSGVLVRAVRPVLCHSHNGYYGKCTIYTTHTLPIYHTYIHAYTYTYRLYGYTGCALPLLGQHTRRASIWHYIAGIWRNVTAVWARQ